MNFSELCRFLNEKFRMWQAIHIERSTKKFTWLSTVVCDADFFLFFFGWKLLQAFIVSVFATNYQWSSEWIKTPNTAILWIEIGARTVLLSFGLLKVVFPEFDRFLPILWKAFLSKLFTRSAKIHKIHWPNLVPSSKNSTGKCQRFAQPLNLTLNWNNLPKTPTKKKKIRNMQQTNKLFFFSFLITINMSSFIILCFFF